MRPGAINEIIFENTLEARVAYQHLFDLGLKETADLIKPPLLHPHIAEMDFWIQIIDSHRRYEDGKEYILAPGSMSHTPYQAMVLTAEDCPAWLIPKTRREYIGQMLADYMQKMHEQNDQETL